MSVSIQEKKESLAVLWVLVCCPLYSRHVQSTEKEHTSPPLHLQEPPEVEAWGQCGSTKTLGPLEKLHHAEGHHGGDTPSAGGPVGSNHDGGSPIRAYGGVHHACIFRNLPFWRQVRSCASASCRSSSRRCCSHKVSRVQNLVRSAESLRDRSVQHTRARLLRRTAVLSPLGLAIPARCHHSNRVQMAALRNAQQRVRTQSEHARRSPQGRGSASKFMWTGGVGAIASGAPVDFHGFKSAALSRGDPVDARELAARNGCVCRSTPRTSWR